ncbi:hypothetical protein HKK72_21240 [Actinomadura sp. HBU206391]|nr:hypothetical protein [Actinomadura sp. HBU206391]
MALMPSDLPARVFTTATSPGLAEERADIAEWAEPFDHLGWPVPVDAAPRRDTRTGGRTARLWPAVAAAACVLLMVGAGFIWLPSSSKESPRGGSSPGAAAAPDVSDPASVEPSEPESESPEPTPTPTTTSPTPTPTTSRPTPTPSRRPSSRPTTRRPTIQPRPGTITVSGCNVDEGEPCQLTITAQGGNVNWSVTGASGGVGASGGGPLKNGQSTTITAVTPCEPGDSDDHSGSVTFSPGGVSAPVSWDCDPF